MLAESLKDNGLCALATRQRFALWTVESVKTRESRESCESFSTHAGKCQCDNSRYEGKTTHETHETHEKHLCQDCVNFNPNTMDPASGPGICEVSPDGGLSKMPDAGGDCAAFERMMH